MQLQRANAGVPPPYFLVRVASKGVTARNRVSVDSKELKVAVFSMSCAWFVSVDSKRLVVADSSGRAGISGQPSDRQLTAERIEKDPRTRVRRPDARSGCWETRMRGTKVDDTGSEMRGVKERSFGLLRSLRNRILFGCSVFLEGLGERGYVHPPAFRMVIKTKWLLNLIVVSD